MIFLADTECSTNSSKLLQKVVAVILQKLNFAHENSAHARQ